jgi:hypothetical protein
VIFLPFAFVVVLYTTETISQAVLFALAVVAFLAASALILYWVFARIRPLSNEIEALRAPR